MTITYDPRAKAHRERQAREAAQSAAFGRARANVKAYRPRGRFPWLFAILVIAAAAAASAGLANAYNASDAAFNGIAAHVETR